MGECYQWKAHGQCSKGDSCSFSHDTQTSGNSGEVRVEKDDRPLLHPVRRPNRLTARDKNPQKDMTKKKTALWKRVKFHADSNSTKSVM